MDDEIDENEWLRSGVMNDVFEFLADDGEDIYTIEDALEISMTGTAENIIKTFDELPPTEQREVATEILRRTIELQFPPLSDEELIQNAEEIFLELDSREAADGES